MRLLKNLSAALIQLTFATVLTVGTPVVLALCGASPVSVAIGFLFVGSFMLVGVVVPAAADLMDGK